MYYLKKSIKLKQNENTWYTGEQTVHPQKFHWFCPHLEMFYYRCLSSCTKRFSNMEKVCSENVLK